MPHLRQRPLGVAVALALAFASHDARPPQPAADGGAQLVQQASRELLAQFDTSSGTLQSLTFKSQHRGRFTVEVVLDGERVQLVLWPHSLRTEDYRLRVQGEDGELMDARPGPTTTYRGIVAGQPDSIVAGSAFAGRWRALVRLSADELWSLQPVSSIDDADPSGGDVEGDERYIVMSSHDTLASGTCGSEEESAESEVPLLGVVAGSNGGEPIQYTCRIVCDADLDFYERNHGSILATQADIESILNGVDAIFQADARVIYELGTLVVRTAENDPYEETNAGEALSEFQAEWIFNQGGIQRDIAHLFTGKELDGTTIGIAWISGICDLLFGYGLSQSHYTANFESRVGLTAHELGHNFSANHCNESPSGCHIMCSSIGACGPVTSFAPTATDKISSFAEFASCLEESGGTPPEPPVVSAVVPPTVPALTLGNDLHVSLFGTDLDTVFSIRIDGQDLGDAFPAGFVIVSAGQIDLKLPLLSALGEHELTVIGTSGNFTTSLEAVVNDPPAVEIGEGTEPEALHSLSPTVLTFAGQPGNLGFLWASLSSVPTVAPGVFELAIGADFQDLHLIGIVEVASTGWAQASAMGSKLPPNTTVYVQAFEVDMAQGVLPAESTNVATGIWLF